MKKLLLLSFCIFIIYINKGNLAASQDADDNVRFRAPEGFVVEVAATPEQTGSIVAMTFDSRGRPVLSRERGPVIILEDRDRDGKYETLKTYTDKVKNCQGLCFIGNDLLAVGDGPDGAALYRVYDRDGDDVGEEVRTIEKFKGGMGEHGPHAVFVGPDGFLYVVIGNHAGISRTPDPLSPHRDYYEGQLLPSYPDPRGHARQIRAPGGTIFRVDLEGRNWQMFAGGFRNQYDAAFNWLGELFTFDADMEWDIGLPWFRPVRTDHVIPGGEFGWRTGSGKWPDYYPDSLPPMTDVGRGSPVGVEFYLHYAYPEKYYDSFILGDWSRGRILVGFPKKAGATYAETQENLVLGEPINVSDLEVGPDGFLYFANGGRDTEGGLYRVAYRGNEAPRVVPRDKIDEALLQPQPRSAWGRARLQQLKNELGQRWGEALLSEVKNASAKAERRVRALELLQVYGPAPGEELLVFLGADPQWEVRAASTYYLGLHATASSRKELVKRLRDGDAFVRRRACEALVRTGINPIMELDFSPAQELLPLLSEPDRWMRYAARLALQSTNRNLWKEAMLKEKNPVAAIEGLLAVVQTIRGTNDIDEVLRKEIDLLKLDLPADDLLRLLRVIHLTFLNDQGVERPQVYNQIASNLLARFPTADWRLNRELARTLAHLQTPGTIEKLFVEMSKDKTDREQQIFYAYCLRAIKTGWTSGQKEEFIKWFEKTQKERWKGGASFLGFIENMWNSFLETMGPEERAKAMARVPDLSPDPAASGGRVAPAFTRKPYTRILSDQELAEYLLWDPMSYKGGSVVEGKKAYQKAYCDRCHIYGDIGIEAGPDLTNVGKRFKRKDMIEAVIYPSKTISDLWAAVEITTTDGQSLIGTIASEDAEKVVLQQMGGAKVSVPKQKIKTRAVSKTSMMPEGLLDNLSMKEIIDLFTFLERGNR